MGIINYTNITNVDDLVRCIIEFYNTSNEEIRKDHQVALNCFQKNDLSWHMAMALVSPTQPAIVQFYGAKILYDALNTRFDNIAENLENTNILQSFFIQKLTTSAASLPHSVLNKLSSGLAIFVLKSLPDIWPEPFKELSLLWSSQPELLLRIFAEIAAEFPRLNVPLDQRNSVKNELGRVCKEIVRIAHGALIDPESSASLKNAAVECLELWLKLPNAKLADFMEIFAAIFETVSNDIVTLSRILCTLKANDELPNLPQLIWKISSYIAFSVCPMVINELDSISSSVDECSIADEFSEITPLICAIVDFVHGFLDKIVAQTIANLDDPNYTNVYFSLCAFFSHLSNLKGQYPNRECVSDLPEPFWFALREELMDGSGTHSGHKKLLLAESTKFFITILETSIHKIAYFPNIGKTFDKAQFERFGEYRIARGDVSSNAIQMAAEETVNLLANRLNQFIDEHDIFKAESTLYLIKEAADFLKESHLDILVPVLLMCGTSDQWSGFVQQRDAQTRFASVFLALIQQIEHLILTSATAKQILPALMHIVLSYFEWPETDTIAINTTFVLLKSRDKAVEVVLDEVISKCYAYFSDDRHRSASRLAAIRCVGTGLSFKETPFILNSLDQILAPRLVVLRELINGTAGLSPDRREEAILFELSVLAQLVLTLEKKKVPSNGQALVPPPSPTPAPVRMIIDQCMPLLNELVSRPNPSVELIAKVCDILKASVQSLHDQIEPLIDTYLAYLDTIIFAHSAPASDLAKSLFLLGFSKGSKNSPTFIRHLAKWYLEHSKRFLDDSSSIVASEADEKLIELAYHLVKKSWAAIVDVSESTASDVSCFLHSLCWILVRVIETSQDITLLRDAFRVLTQVIKSCIASDNQVLVNCLHSVAEKTIAVVFAGIQRETMSANITAIADVLQCFAQAYPAETRTIIRQLPGGDSQLVEAMLNQNTVRNFRLRVSQMHQAALLQRQS